MIMSSIHDDLRQLGVDLQAEVSSAGQDVQDRFQKFVNRIMGLVRRHPPQDANKDK